MEIEVWELSELLHMLNAEIHREKVVKTDQEHAMDCERNWEEGYDKGYQDAKNELKDEAEKSCKINEEEIEKINEVIEERIIDKYAPRLQRWIEEQIMPKCKDELKNELKNEAEKKAISNQMPLEDLTPAPPIDRITEERINRHFCIPPEHFGHHGFLYKLSKKEYCKAIAFINKIYNKHDRNNELTYCYQPVSDGIGIAITIVCD